MSTIRPQPCVECRSLQKHFKVKTYDVPTSVGSMTYTASRKIISTLLNRTQTKIVRAIDGVDLEVQPGTWLGLLGPNGSGKTTLLKLMAGLINPTKGSVRVMGHDTVTESERVLDLVHFVPGLATGCMWIDGTLTVRQNLGFIASLYGFGKDDVDEAIHTVGLAQVSEQRTGTLSTGTTARMILALGLIRDVPIYLFDEPAIGLDPLAVRSFSDMIKTRVARRTKGGAVVYALHMLTEIERTCDRVAFLREGKIIATDSLESVRGMLGPSRRIKVKIRPSHKAQQFIDRLASTGKNSIKMKATTKPETISGASGQSQTGEGPESLIATIDASGLDEVSVAEKVLLASRETGIEILSLEVAEPSLEEVFTHLMTHPDNREEWRRPDG